MSATQPTSLQPQPCMAINNDQSLVGNPVRQRQSVKENNRGHT